MVSADFPNFRQAWPVTLLFASLAVLMVIVDRAPLHLEARFPQVQIDQEFYDYQNGVVDRTLPGPFVYRILIPYSYSLVSSAIPLSEITIDAFVKVAVLLACQIAFFVYLRLFCSEVISLTGVVLFDFLISYSLSYIPGPSVIETIDLVNALIFCVGLLVLCQDRLPVLLGVLFIGMLNRETPWIFLPILVLYEWANQKRLSHVLAVTLVLATPYLGLRFLVDTSVPTWFTSHDMVFNIPFLSAEASSKALVANIHLAVLLGPLLLLGVLNFRQQPRFLQIASVAVPILIVIHYIFGSIIERRLWMPVYVFLIPLVLKNLAKMLGDGAVR